MNNSYVVYNGKIVPESEVSISIRSKVFNYGLGCFEGIRAYYSESDDQLYAFRLDDHYKRLLQSCNLYSAQCIKKSLYSFLEIFFAYFLI
jgi:branched-chain amino acid aminotransferase